MSSDWEIFKLQLAALGGLLFLSLAVTWVILYYVRLLDHPNERSSHVLATPKCGGVGIVVSFIAGVYLSQIWGGKCIVDPAVLYSLILPVSLVASVSLADDIQELSPQLRLIVHVAASLLLLLMIGVGRGANELGMQTVAMQILLIIGGVFWVVGMANAFNFMDGIDGLAAGQGLITSFFFSIIHIGRGECFLGFVSLVLMVGCLGFLAFNFPPAKVFMGDVGSISIGFILAALAVISFHNNPTIETLIIMPLLMSNFIFDTVVTFLKRLIKRESILQGHRTHFYQKLASCGFSQRTVTMTNYGLAIIQGIIVLLAGEKPIVALAMCVGLEVAYASVVINMTKIKYLNG